MPHSNANKPIEKLVFIFSLKEAFHFLYECLSAYDSSEEFSYAILSLINASVMEQENIRGAYDDAFTDAMNELKNVGLSEREAYEICAQVADMIIQILTLVVPDFNDNRYDNNYIYHLRNNHDVQLTISKAAFA